MKNRLDAAPLNQLLHIALFESGINFWMSKGPWDTNHINSLSKLLVCRVLLSEPCHTILADEHFAPQIIFAPWNTLHPNSLCAIHFTPWQTLLLRTLYVSAHFAIQHTFFQRPPHFLADQKAPPGSGGVPHYYRPPGIFDPCYIPEKYYWNCPLNGHRQQI